MVKFIISLCFIYLIIYYHAPEETTIANCYGQNWTTNKYIKQFSLNCTFVLLGIPAKLNKTCSLQLDIFFAKEIFCIQYTLTAVTSFSISDSIHHILYKMSCYMLFLLMMTGQQNFAVTLVTSENNCVHIFYTDFSLDSVHGSFATVVDKKCFSYCIEGAESKIHQKHRITH